MLKTAAQKVAQVDTKARLRAGARQVLVEHGYGAATARAIGEAAGVNQALIFYHYGGVTELLLAVLDESSDQRLGRYQHVLAGTTSLGGLLQAAARLHHEDRESGHVAVLTQLVAGGLADRTLARVVAGRVEPWVDLTEEAVGRVLRRTTLRRLVPARELSYAIVALYLGLEVLGTLAGDHARSDAVLERMRRVGARLDRLGAPWRS